MNMRQAWTGGGNILCCRQIYILAVLLVCVLVVARMLTSRYKLVRTAGKKSVTREFEFEKWVLLSNGAMLRLANEQL